jgi:hypothetical protein
MKEYKSIELTNNAEMQTCQDSKLDNQMEIALTKERCSAETSSRDFFDIAGNRKTLFIPKISNRAFSIDINQKITRYSQKSILGINRNAAD